MEGPTVDLVVVGAGAAGLMTAIWCARQCATDGVQSRIVLVDGAKKIGAKILVAGGGRCNVTHDRVLPKDYAGTSRNTIKNALKAFSEKDTVEFFSGLGVDLKREDTGKLFPVTNSAKTVLNSLLNECDRLGIQLLHPWRVKSIEPTINGFRVVSTDISKNPLDTRFVVIATGGMALPRTGSDGAGYSFVKKLGHRVTERIEPSLVPMITGESSRWITELSGISALVSIEVHSGTGKRLVRFTNQVLCTHFGLSGPAALDVSRWYFESKFDDPNTKLVINWLNDQKFDNLDVQLQEIGKQSVSGFLRTLIPDRLGKMLCLRCDIDPASPGHSIKREQRRALAHMLVDCEVEISGNRGFTFAEVTAGGVPLDEIQISTMQSRACDGLWLVGEVLDVDGRIGGFNFQWAWSNGFIAGKSIADKIASTQL
ncbi:MAG: NAD(P)/FAD-dependent oxidoreductase [Phycisphaerales bacterium]|nr:NAD(P)/FAD-dependent oxidoreductase [Phycisphaerales bacterium]